MDEISRIYIEEYCEKHKRSKNAKWLAELVERSYDIECEYTCDEEACFVEHMIETTKDEQLREALIDLDQFFIGM